MGRYYPNFLLFLAAMYGLLSTADMMWFFFLFWQMMTLPGYALIRFESQKRENIRAANKFLVMMQIACAATMIGAELLAVTGAATTGVGGLKYDFDTVSANLPHCSPLCPAQRPWPSRFSSSASASRWACGPLARSGCRTRIPPRPRP